MPVETMALPKRWRSRMSVGRESVVDRGGGDTYGGSRGPDTVEHVRSQGDGDEEVFGVADAHHVARLVRREPVCAGVHTGFLTFSSFPTP